MGSQVAKIGTLTDIDPMKHYRFVPEEPVALVRVLFNRPINCMTKDERRQILRGLWALLDRFDYPKDMQEYVLFEEVVAEELDGPGA